MACSSADDALLLLEVLQLFCEGLQKSAYAVVYFVKIRYTGVVYRAKARVIVTGEGGENSPSVVGKTTETDRASKRRIWEFLGGPFCDVMTRLRWIGTRALDTASRFRYYSHDLIGCAQQLIACFENPTQRRQSCLTCRCMVSCILWGSEP